MRQSLTCRIPWALVIFIIALVVPWLGSRYYTFLATQITILSLFAVSYNLLLGSAGLVSFGHAAYFGLGSYACGLLMKELGVPFVVGLIAGGLMSAGFAAVFGYFCVRLTKIYFSMLTLAFAQIVWAICFQWNELTGGDQGVSGIPYPNLLLRQPGHRHAVHRRAAPHQRLAIRPHAHHDPREPGACFVHRRECQSL
jgi:branched-chain amino acid transport system permease protein